MTKVTDSNRPVGDRPADESYEKMWWRNADVVAAGADELMWHDPVEQDRARIIRLALGAMEGEAVRLGLLHQKGRS